MRKVLKRLGCSFHKVSGFLFKANQEKQKEFIEEYEQDKGQAAQEGWRRYFRKRTVEPVLASVVTLRRAAGAVVLSWQGPSRLPCPSSEPPPAPRNDGD